MKSQPVPDHAVSHFDYADFILQQFLSRDPDRGFIISFRAQLFGDMHL
jgi:hypothetical protein